MKRKIFKSSLILLFGGIITKVLGMVIKIMMSRIVGIKGVSLYMMVLPTFSLFMSIGQIGLPLSLSRLVALDDRNNLNLYFSVIPFVLISNIVLMFLLILSSSFISTSLLHNPDLRISLIAVSLVIPFTSISGICRSYFIGKERVFPTVFSNVCENIVRLLFVILVLPRVLFLELKYIVFMIIISNIISEFCSVLVLLIFTPKKIDLSSMRFNLLYVKDAFSLSIYNLCSNLIGNISYFFEPIILTNIFLYVGYSLNYVSSNYGIITGYVLPLLLIPSFFTNAISQAILPSISKDYNTRRYNSIKRKIVMLSAILLLFGTCVSLIYFFFGDKLLLILYNTAIGFQYLKFLAPFFIIYYIQAPFHVFLYAMGRTKDDLFLTIISSIVRTLSLLLLSLLKIGIYSFLLSIVINLIVTTFLLYKAIFKSIKQ